MPLIKLKDSFCPKRDGHSSLAEPLGKRRIHDYRVRSNVKWRLFPTRQIIPMRQIIAMPPLTCRVCPVT
jgi:hypothetical protein